MLNYFIYDLVQGVLRRDGLATQFTLVVGGWDDAGLTKVRRLVQLQAGVPRERRIATLLKMYQKVYDTLRCVLFGSWNKL